MFVRSLSLFVVSAACLCAQITAPPQPTSGPGSNAYLYGVVQNGPYNAKHDIGTDSYTYYIFTPVGLTPTVSNPNPLPTPSTAPVVLFIHGYDGDTLAPYQYWMEQMAQMGSSVIWVLYDQVSANQFASAVITDYQAALKALTEPGLIPPVIAPDGQPLTAIVGHSSGAWLAYIVASEAATSGIPYPMAVVAVEPGQGQIPSFNASKMNANTLVVTVVGDEDKTDRICQGVDVYNQLTQIPAVQKPFLLARTDAYGYPVQEGNHWFPLTDTNKDTLPGPVTIDDRDYNITYKLGVATMACLVRGQYCDYVYGNGPMNSYGATTQTDMGLWSDGTPVLPMALIQNPSSYFPTCATGGSKQQ
jgi:hypothetical protein